MAERHGLTRGLGLLEATALNMSNMVGVGPFVTIPLMIGAMGGPQCMLGWAVGAVLALCDGLVWAELAAAMPGEGGSYLYLREAFRRTRLGALLPFLFIWQFIFSGPLEISTGYIGFAQYLGYFRGGIGVWETRLGVLVVGLLVIALLVGTEGAGLSARWLAGADMSVRIPMSGGVSSLNAASAAAIACYVLGPGNR